MAQTRPVEDDAAQAAAAAVPGSGSRLAAPLPEPRAHLARVQPPRAAEAQDRRATRCSSGSSSSPSPASNLDEFFMKRIGGLKQQVAAGVQRAHRRRPHAAQQIAECYAVIRDLERAQRELLRRAARASCAEHDIRIAAVRRPRRRRSRQALRDHYCDNIFPLVTPQAMDPAHPFPFISNLSLNLLVTLRYPKDTEPLLARVKVPVGAGIPRFLRVGDGAPLRAARGRDGAQPRPALPGHGDRRAASCSASPATPTPSATRRRPTTCWR